MGNNAEVGKGTGLTRSQWSGGCHPSLSRKRERERGIQTRVVVALQVVVALLSKQSEKSFRFPSYDVIPEVDALPPLSKVQTSSRSSRWEMGRGSPVTCAALPPHEPSVEAARLGSVVARRSASRFRASHETETALLLSPLLRKVLSQVTAALLAGVLPFTGDQSSITWHHVLEIDSSCQPYRTEMVDRGVTSMPRI